MSKGKEKTNGSEQKGTAVAERASGRSDVRRGPGGPEHAGTGLVGG